MISRKKGPKPPSSVLRMEHERENRGRIVTRPDVQLEAAMGRGDYHREEQRITPLALADRELRHGVNVVQRPGVVLTVVVHRILDDVPDRVRAGHGEFPVFARDAELAEIDKDSVLDGLTAGIGEHDVTKRIIGSRHGIVPFGL
jgi:hypothetical protein